MSETNTSAAANLPEGIAKCATTCPMCGHKHAQYRINPQLYWFTDAEIDRKPSGFHCRQSLEGYYPPLYEIWHCPQCHYTAHNRVFPDPLKHVYIEKTMVGRRLEEMRKGNPGMQRVTEALGTGLAFEKTDFVQAIRLNLLEIYYLRFLVDILNQGHEGLARSYLRLAWMIRDWHAMVPERAEQEAKLNRLLDAVSADWPECPRSENDALEMACRWFVDALNRTQAGENPVETCTTMMQVARIRVKMEALDEARTQLADCQRTIMSELDTLTRVMNEDLRTRKLTEEQRGKMLSDSRKLRSMIDECRILFEKVGKKPVADPRKRAEALIAANPRMAGTALRKVLEDNGIPAQLARELVPEKREGLFGGLFK